MRPDEVPGAILHDIWATITTAQITGFVWVLIAFAIVSNSILGPLSTGQTMPAKSRTVAPIAY